MWNIRYLLLHVGAITGKRYCLSYPVQHFHKLYICCRHVFGSFDINIFWILATYNQRADDVSSMLNEELSRLMHESQNCLSYTLRMYSSFTVIFIGIYKMLVHCRYLHHEYSNMLYSKCVFFHIGGFDPCPWSSPKKQCNCGGCYYKQRVFKVMTL